VAGERFHRNGGRCSVLRDAVLTAATSVGRRNPPSALAYPSNRSNGTHTPLGTGTRISLKSGHRCWQSELLVIETMTTLLPRAIGIRTRRAVSIAKEVPKIVPLAAISPVKSKRRFPIGKCLNLACLAIVTKLSVTVGAMTLLSNAVRTERHVAFVASWLSATLGSRE